MTIIRINARDIPPATIKAVLLKSHAGLEDKPRLTDLIDGYFYAVVASGAVEIFKMMLGEMFVDHDEVDSLPRKPQRPTRPATPFFVTPLFVPTGNKVVDDAAARYTAARLDAAAAFIRRMSK